MSTTTKPTRRTPEPIAEHAYTFPVVRELPIRPPRGASDATW